MSDTRQDENEWVPYKAKAATMDDFLSSIVAKPNVTNDMISSSWNQHREDPWDGYARHLELLHELCIGGLAAAHTHLCATKLIFMFYGMLNIDFVAMTFFGATHELLDGMFT